MLHPAINDINNRRAAIDKALKSGKADPRHLMSDYAYVYKDDSQISDLRIYWGPTIGGMLKVKIRETE